MNIILFDSPPQHLPKEDYRTDHLIRILKRGPGDTFKAGIVNGPVGEGRISAVTEDGIELEWRETGPPAGLYPLELIVGFVRPICAKRILRDAASLGVRRLTFTVTDTGEKSYRRAKLWESGEYRRYLLDGVQQAGATCLPEVDFAAGVREAGASAAERVEAAGRVLLDNAEAGTALARLTLPAEGVAAAVGSERGWSPRERRLFWEADFTPVTVGSRILRTETACCAGVALLLARMGLL
jgi:RsmE family RNA methyltransferase